jgi:hypothetical protein
MFIYLHIHSRYWLFPQCGGIIADPFYIYALQKSMAEVKTRAWSDDDIRVFLG